MANLQDGQASFSSSWKSLLLTNYSKNERSILKKFQEIQFIHHQQLDTKSNAMEMNLYFIQIYKKNENSKIRTSLCYLLVGKKDHIL